MFVAARLAYGKIGVVACCFFTVQEPTEEIKRTLSIKILPMIFADLRMVKEGVIL